MNKKRRGQYEQRTERINDSKTKSNTESKKQQNIGRPMQERMEIQHGMPLQFP